MGLQVLAVEELLVGFQPLGSATRPLACSIEDHQTRKGFLGDESVKHDVNSIVGHEGVVGDGFVGAVVDGVVVVVVGDIDGEKHLFRLGVRVGLGSGAFAAFATLAALRANRVSAPVSQNATG